MDFVLLMILLGVLSYAVGVFAVFGIAYFIEKRFM